MDLDMIQIGSRIKKRRKDLGFTQPEVYQKCGIDSGSLSKIESGLRTPSVIIFYKIAQVLDCEMEWLLTGDFANSQITPLCQKEDILINNFRKLSAKDQDEIQDFIEYKVYVLSKRKNKEKLSFSENISQENIS